MAPPLLSVARRVGLDVVLRVAGSPRVLRAVARGTDVRAQAGRAALDAVVEMLAGVGTASGADLTRLTEEVGRLSDRVEGLSSSLDRLEATLARLSRHSDQESVDDESSDPVA